MKQFILFLSFNLILTGYGAGLLWFIGLRKRSKVEWLALSYLLGLTILSLLAFLTALTPIPLSSELIRLEMLVTLGGIAAYSYHPLLQSHKNPTGLERNVLWGNLSMIKKTLLLVMLCSVLYKLTMASWFAFTTPPLFDDAIAHWNGRGKSIYVDFGIFFDKTRDDVSFLAGDTIHYPFLIPITKATLAFFMDEWHEGYLNFMHTLSLTAFSIIFFKFIHRRTGDIFLSCVLPFLYLSIPLVFIHSFSSLADTTVGTFMALSFLFFVDWMFEVENTEAVNYSLLIISGVMLFGAAFTKNDGIVFGFCNLSAVAFVFFLQTRDRRYLIPSAVAFALMLPHTILRFVFGLSINPISDNTITYHSGTFSEIFDAMFGWADLNIFWYGAPFVLLLSFQNDLRGKLPIQFAVFFILIFGALIVFTFGWTANHAWLKDHTTIGRALMQYAASLLVFISVLATEVNKRNLVALKR